MADPPVRDSPPPSAHVTDYDRSNFKTYLRLLDADAEDADWREVAEIVLGLDPHRDPERVRRIYQAHLERALWMTRVGYRDLIWGHSAH